MKFISLRSVAQTLKERKWWSFCAALATDRPMAISPQVRVLA
jgi:hypothetical protein